MTHAGPPVGEKAHDPGIASAHDRAEQAPRAVAPIERDGRELLIGISAWTEPTLIAPGVWYPENVRTAEERLRWYARHFPLVEVDSTYYAIPARRTAELWVERTPANFVFDLKAHALMTGQPSEPSRLPKALRDALPDEIRAKRRVYASELPAEVHDAVWSEFVSSLTPLAASGKLGAIILQYPRWFLPNRESKDAILQARERLQGLPVAVEFRNARWFSETGADRTLRFLEDEKIPLVLADTPPGMASSLPALGIVTSPKLAIARFHGRRRETWEKANAVVSERYRYLYDRDELSEWAERIKAVAKDATSTHAVFNNCYGNYAVVNALEFGGMLRAETIEEGFQRNVG